MDEKEWEQWQRKCYGVTEEILVETWGNISVTDKLWYAASMMSDAQESLEFAKRLGRDDPDFDRYTEDNRMYLNRAKWLIFRVMEELRESTN